jgi:hypothetical protein
MDNQPSENKTAE